MITENKVFFLHLGCDKNKIDSEMVKKKIVDGNYVLTDNPWQADVAVINTCGFIDIAKEEAIDSILTLSNIRDDDDSKLSKIIVIGCLAERYRDEILRNLPEVDAVAGLAYNGDIVRIIRDALLGKKITAYGNPLDMPIDGERLLTEPHHVAYIRIAEGCSNTCTYCAIPSIRGGYRSRSPQAILKEAKTLALSGVKELIVVAQDTTSYSCQGMNISSILKLLAGAEGFWKIRLLYTYPDKITDELLSVIASEEKIAKYLDIPLQHCSEKVLKRMGRKGSRRKLSELIDKIRNAVPGITIRTTFIVGFPGEEEEDFEELYNFIEEMRFDRAGFFEFSAEEGTPAARLDRQIGEKVKSGRMDKIILKQNEILESLQKIKIGKELGAICDGYCSETGNYIFRSEADLPEVDTVINLICDRKIASGTVRNIHIKDVDGVDLVGTL
jgi:ribosomal protein S12 methylthiotransferase